jgi:hypothetical protein
MISGRHPIETTRYILGTPVINRFHDEVCQWIDNRVTGGMIYGRPRLGKTRAILYLSKALPQRFGRKLPIINLPCRNYRAPSESAFFEDLLRAAGHALPKKGKSTEKRDRLREFLSEKVDSSKQDRLILFVDEAQKLHEHQYNWLIDLHNELDENSISLVVLLVGQPELAHQHSAFNLTKKSQIIGRFMVHRLEFHGLRSVKDVEVCLTGYDEASEYPANSGWSFTQYYFPAAFFNGWRLASLADDLWEAFRQTKEEFGFPGALDIPMQYFCRAVEYTLRRYSSLEDAPHIFQ